MSQWRVLVGFVAVLGVMVGVVALVSSDGCESPLARVDPPVEAWFAPLGSLDHDDDAVAEMVAAATGLPYPFGQLRTAGVFDSPFDAPIIRAVGDETGIVVHRPLSPEVTSFASVVDMPEGTTRWARQITGRQPYLGGVDGLVVGVASPDGDRPVVATFDPAEGRTMACVRLDAATFPPVVVARGGNELVVAYAVYDADARTHTSVVSRIDPTTAEELWSAELDFSGLGSLRVVGDLVAISTPSITTGDLLDVNPGRVEEGAHEPVLAHAIDDGSLLWQYPDVPGSPGTVFARVVGISERSESIVIEHVDVADGQPVRTFSGVGLDGAERWSRAVDDARSTQSFVTGDTLLVTTRGDSERMLHGWDAADGTDRWSAPVGRDGGSLEPWRSASAGSLLFVPTGESILVVDLDTADQQVVELPWFVRHIDHAGGHLMVTAWHSRTDTDVMLVFEVDG